jgi:hypothetical protein
MPSFWAGIKQKKRQLGYEMCVQIWDGRTSMSGFIQALLNGARSL